MESNRKRILSAARSSKNIEIIIIIMWVFSSSVVHYTYLAMVKEAVHEQQEIIEISFKDLK